jgi:hypothetical protein
MVSSAPHPPEIRRRIEAQLRAPEPTMRAIAAQAGLPYTTVKRWNQEARIRPWTHVAKLKLDPATWTARRMAAVAQVFGCADLDPGDVSEALGARRGDAAALMLACGVAATRVSARLGPPGTTPDLAALDAALRVHIVRQIAAFDEKLSQPDAAIDSARTLRDLAGLRRILDDIAARTHQPDFHGDADGGSPQDLAALRDCIARRYEAFAAERNDAGLSEPPGAGGIGEPGA